jgi:hypothetical protein
MLKVLAILFGLIMITMGILGFLPEYAPGGLLLGIFSASLIHNAIRIGIGLIAILCGFSSYQASKWFFIIFVLATDAAAVFGLYY